MPYVPGTVMSNWNEPAPLVAVVWEIVPVAVLISRIAVPGGTKLTSGGVASFSTCRATPITRAVLPASVSGTVTTTSEAPGLTVNGTLAVANKGFWTITRYCGSSGGRSSKRAQSWVVEIGGSSPAHAPTTCGVPGVPPPSGSTSVTVAPVMSRADVTCTTTSRFAAVYTAGGGFGGARAQHGHRHRRRWDVGVDAGRVVEGERELVDARSEPGERVLADRPGGVVPGVEYVAAPGVGEGFVEMTVAPVTDGSGWSYVAATVAAGGAGRRLRCCGRRCCRRCCPRAAAAGR